ncbi:hypothetical protein SPB21_05805 [Leptothoe sp. ISB3NOV94-8A]
MVETSLSVENWVAVSQMFGLTDLVDEVNGSTTSTSTPVLLSSFLHHGQLTVVASDNQGTLFTNPTDLSARITFIPDVNGRWFIERPRPIDQAESEILELDSQGSEEWANVATVDSYRPLGAILFRRESWDDNTYKKVGTQITKGLDPGENIYLVCNFYREGYEVPGNVNLATNLYSSNSDSITVWWFLEVDQEEPTRGEFTVKATSRRLFTNNFDRTLTFYFVAEGTWQIFPTGQLIEYIGYTAMYTEAAATYLLPGAPAGCVLVGRGETIKVETGDSGLDGDDLVPLNDQRSWSLDPGETILFVANGDLSHATKHEDGQDGDIDWTFEKHSGEIAVKWTVVEVS